MINLWLNLRLIKVLLRFFFFFFTSLIPINDLFNILFNFFCFLFYTIKKLYFFHLVWVINKILICLLHLGDAQLINHFQSFNLFECLQNKIQFSHYVLLLIVFEWFEYDTSEHVADESPKKRIILRAARTLLDKIVKFIFFLLANFNFLILIVIKNFKKFNTIDRIFYTVCPSELFSFHYCLIEFGEIFIKLWWIFDNKDAKLRSNTIKVYFFI